MRLFYTYIHTHTHTHTHTNIECGKKNGLLLCDTKQRTREKIGNYKVLLVCCSFKGSSVFKTSDGGIEAFPRQK